MDNEWKDLEARVAELDALAAQAKTADEHATVSARRRFLLIALDSEGLLDAAQAPEVRERLERLGLPVLQGYHASAMELLRYYGSIQRRRYIPGASSRPILGGPVSLDWFRRPDHTPGTYNPFAWLGCCENIFVDTRHPEADGFGEIFMRVDGAMAHLAWRRDDGVTANLIFGRHFR
ncbi:hypothetical protein [Corallococcus aberystwythensis]|nr:hypothetical protein [Corallococcus aberystwythensis]